MKTKISDQLHSSVSNLGDITGSIIQKPVFKNPSTGQGKKVNKVTNKGIEEVPGFKFREYSSNTESSLWMETNFPDIGEASFGAPPPRIEIVHGEDNRIQISDTTVYPWRVYASLLITARDNSQWLGTAWFISPRTLITAGHCVYIKNSNVPGRDGWVKSISVMPARNGLELPYGSVISTNFKAVTGWTNDGNPNFDYGAIILSTNIGNSTGWFGFGVYTDSDLKSTIGNVSGYPSDKPTGTQWYDAHKIDEVDSRKIYYDIDTVGGQSGSAVTRIINGNRFAIAIHAYGDTVYNSGTRITQDVYNNLVNWKA